MMKGKVTEKESSEEAALAAKDEEQDSKLAVRNNNDRDQGSSGGTSGGIAGQNSQSRSMFMGWMLFQPFSRRWPDTACFVKHILLATTVGNAIARKGITHVGDG